MRPLATGKRQFGHFAMVAVLLATAVVGNARAQDGGTLIADGLNGPMGVLVTPDGTVWVVDSGTGGDEEEMGFNPVTRRAAPVRIGDTSRILKIGPDGSQTLAATLPSRMYDPTNIYGGARLALLAGEIYATSSAWSEPSRSWRRCPAGKRISPAPAPWPTFP